MYEPGSAAAVTAAAVRFGFAGTPVFAEVILRALSEAGLHPAVVYTQPDRPAGRGRRLLPSPVKRFALEQGWPLEQPHTLRQADAQRRLAEHRLQLLVVVAYGLILPAPVLALPRQGCVNLHASLLPRWRGAAPIQRCLLAGDRETGVSLMRMDAGLDTGPVYEQRSLRIAEDDTAASLQSRLARLGAECLCQRLPALAAGGLSARPQSSLPGEPCYAAKIDKHEARLDWTRPATALARQVRAFNPWPVAYTELAAASEDGPRDGPRDAERLRVWRAHALEPAELAAPAHAAPGQITAESAAGLVVACGAEGRERLALTELQLPGKKPQPASVFVNARRLLGRRLGAGA